MPETDSFLNIARWCSFYTRIWCLNCFHIPSTRNHTKIQMRSADKKIFIIQASVYVTILLTHNFYQLFSTSSNETNMAFTFMKYLHVMHTVVYIINIFTDIYNRNRIWFIICCIYDFDLVVSIYHSTIQ